MYRVIGVALLLGSSALAQEQRDLARRLDSITVVYNAARAALVAYERQRPDQRAAKGPPLRIDTAVIAAGRVRVLLNAGLGPVGRGAAARADTSLRRLGRGLTIVPPLVFAINGDSARAGRDDRVTVGLRPAGGGSVNSEEPADPMSIAHWIVDKALMMGIAGTQTPFSRWQRGRLPMDSADMAAEPDWRIIRLNLLSSPSLLGRHCYDGVLDACASFLGLRADADPVRHWYDSLARVSAVREHREVAMRDQASATAHCLTGSDSSCAVALWAIDIFVHPPGDDMALETVTREAVAMGGAGAIERLVMNRGSAADALAAAAGAPVDSVLSHWRRKITGHGDGSRDLTIGAVLVAFIWVALLLGAAAVTSRWP